MTGYRDLDHYDAYRDRLLEIEDPRERREYELAMRALAQPGGVDGSSSSGPPVGQAPASTEEKEAA